MKTPKFLKLLARFSVLLASLAIFIVIITTGSFSKSSTSTKPAAARTTAPIAAQRPALQAARGKAKKGLESFLTPRVTLPGFLPASLLSPLPPPPPVESIATYAGDCTTPKTDFNFGENVCVVVSNANLGANERLIWGHTDGRLARQVFINSATVSDTLTLTPTTVIAGETLDNKGTWRVESVDTDFAPVAVTFFTIHDPATPTADLTVYKSGPDQVNENSDVTFTITVANQGPDTGQAVHLADATPAVTTFVSLTQTSGPAFTCSGSNCTIASLAKGAQANFTAVYHTNGVASPTVTSYSAAVSSDPGTGTPTAELHPADNTASGQLTINTNGTTGTCTLTCPDNINATANTTENSVRGAHVTFASADPSGDCGAVTASPVSGSFFPVGPTTVTVTSATGGGSCTFTVTVTDSGTNPPTISCPANQTATANSNCEASVTLGTPSTTGSDVTVIGTRSDGKPMYNCDANGNNCTRRVPDDPFSAGITTVTWTATNSGGSVSCQQTITVNDTTAPTVTAPADSSASADANCQAPIPDYTAGSTASDNCGTPSLTQSPLAGTLVGTGQHTVTVTATDGAGNSSSDTVVFTVNDTTAPTVTAPADSSASADANCQAPIPDYTASTASDNCGTPTLTQSPAAGTLVGLGPHTVTVTATDAAANHSSDDVVFTVNDTTAPVVTAPADSSASANASCLAAIPNYAAGSTATDNCSTSGSITFSQSPAAGTLVGTGQHTVTVTATDGAGNSSSETVVFTVNDTTAPTVTAPADSSASADANCQAPIPDYTASTASDNCGTPTLTQSPAAGTLVGKGAHTVTVTATDGSSNSSSDTVVFTVNDTTAPTVQAPADSSASADANCQSPIPDYTAGSTASDNCGSPTLTQSPAAGTLVGKGAHTVTVTATDGSGNSSSDTVVFTVNDTTAPTITLTGANPQYVECHTSYPELGATAHDNCGSDFAATPSGTVDVNTPGTYTITYNASDAAGNAATAVTRSVIVRDTIAPVITLNGANPQYVECHTSYPELGATANDDCSGSSAATASGTVDVNTPGTYTVTYNASDAAGNAATAVTRSVIVRDTIKPVITRNGPASVTVECHTSYSDAGATASDTCDADVPVTTSGSVNVNAVGTYTLTYNAVDDSGNAADAVTRTVNVIDTTPPVITLNSYAPSMWPPNHKYTTFQLTQFVTGASDSCDTSVGVSSVVIEKVTSDEIENGNGDGNTLNDIIIAADCKSVQLRSEREGNSDGRVYTITFRVSDASGNTTRATAKVVVPHNPGQTAVDSGIHYTVNGSCP